MRSMRPLAPSGVKARISVESGSVSWKFVERHDWTISRGAIAESVTPLIWPPKARNGAPGSALTITGAPVTAACAAGSRYVAYRRSAGAGRIIDCAIRLLMRNPPFRRSVARRSTPLHLELDLGAA